MLSLGWSDDDDADSSWSGLLFRKENIILQKTSKYRYQHSFKLNLITYMSPNEGPVGSNEK